MCVRGVLSGQGWWCVVGARAWNEIIRGCARVRRDLHQIPKIAWREERTSPYIKCVLDEGGGGWCSCAGTGGVAFIAQEVAGAGIGLRAGMDGLTVHEEAQVDYKSADDGLMHC